MSLLVFLLIGAVWAVFLIPSFLEGRRRAPVSATRKFRRSKSMLGTVTAVDPQELRMRRRGVERRRNLLYGLSGGAIFTLLGAILTGGMPWLLGTIVFDFAIGSYVALLVSVRQRQVANSVVPRIGVRDETSTDFGDAVETASVRLVSG